ncbi:branched-chain amino acid ABC transporter permease [Actinomadura parmotrematis]|uniref:ABC transporter permease n=1 Tax=Actinomadura parmotrematis TaxID=2864039 RepID=A0ABS7FQF2_9ACTN|nr:ABC transporter permease [Actinomadura parmotrematis]MBW8482639.1 ABC transporter permease [Actinomadura parmotrematis]
MDGFAAFGIVGLTTAAVYAVIGSGLVLTYVTTGVFNFAHGAAGMMAAFAYWQLSAGWGWPVPVALAVVLLVLAPAFGLLAERALFGPAQRLGQAERLVMTVALLSGLIALARWVWDPNVPRPLPTFFAGRAPLRLGPATVTWHQGLTMVVAVAVAAGLWVLLHRTRTGAEMRATVDDRTLVVLAGGDPVRASRAAWILGTQLAALGGILIAPTVTLDAAQLSLLIVSAYTAAVFGRLRSLPLTFLGAAVVGCTESYLTGYLPQNAYLPGLRLAAPALLLFLALLAFPHRRLRGSDERAGRAPVPAWRGTALLAAAIVAAGTVLAAVLGEGDLVTYGPVFSLGLVALSYVPLAGYAGQISLCQLSMAGVGAVVWAHLGADGAWWALGAAVAVAALAGALVALPALRLSGVYLALGTAAFAVVLDRWIFTLPSFEVLGVRIALFDQGSVELAGPRLFGHRLDGGAELMVLAAVCLALATVAVAALRRSRYGRRLVALRDSEAAYATLGGGLLVAKVAVFALSAGIAGLGGALYGMQLRSVTADQFSLVAGLPVFLVAVIGGLGAIGCGLFTGTAYIGPVNLLVALAPGSQNLVALLPGLAGLGLARNPDGLIPAMRAGVRRLAQGLTARRGESEVPVEWWGVRRPWRPEDGEVLARGIAGS